MSKHIIALTSIFLLLSLSTLQAQQDSIAPQKSAYTRADSMRLVKLNTSGNLMLAGGIGLCGVGSYLIYQGTKVYDTPVVTSPTSAEELERNHRQGIIYMVAGGVGIAGGITLVALGTKNKIQFKRGKNMMSFEPLVIDKNGIGMALHF